MKNVEEKKAEETLESVKKENEELKKQIKELKMKVKIQTQKRVIDVLTNALQDKENAARTGK